MEPIAIKGCRHDILGHYLKAIGLLRVLARCADEQHRDPEAEGWWDADEACFYLRSEKYPDREALMKFFTEHYKPTPVFTPWNTGSGMDRKLEVVFVLSEWRDYWINNKDAVRAHGFKIPDDGSIPSIPLEALRKLAASQQLTLPSTKHISPQIEGRKVTLLVNEEWLKERHDELAKIGSQLQSVVNFTKRVKEEFNRPSSLYKFDVRDRSALENLTVPSGWSKEVNLKTSGKKAVMANLEGMLDQRTLMHKEIAEKYFLRFKEADANALDVFAQLRMDVDPDAAEAFDSIWSSHMKRAGNNPLFLERGKDKGGNVEIFRTYWNCYLAFFKDKGQWTKDSISRSHLEGGVGSGEVAGAPFFPDVVKSYNTGSGWVEDKQPLNPLDYLLAIEGALAMRGTTSRALAANARRYAAFPFVFDSGEEAVDNANEFQGTMSALWLPLWRNRVTYAEVTSFITDAQVRLFSREARFSAEFLRAIHAQGVDTGFTGWQEFRFRMKGQKTPWVTTGRYIDSRNDETTLLLNMALRPLDESNFLDQFEIHREEDGKVSRRSPHPVRAMLIEAMEDAFVQPTAGNALALLEALFSACKRMAVSKSFREVLRGGPTFFAPLPMEHWERILKPLEPEPEFRIARALASMIGREKQSDGGYSDAQPMLGSVLPLAHGRRWYLPDDGRSRQAVWSGTDIALDLCAVLRRRYMDSLDDDRPALRAVHGAELNDVLAFLEGELDDQRIMRWTEALSLIGWRFTKEQEPAEEDGGTTEGTEADRQRRPIPMAYAALRTLLDFECEWQGKDRSQWKKRRSQQPFALLAQRSGSALPGAVAEALRWISIWGVRNPWGREARAEQPVLSGRQVLNMTANAIADPLLASRLAAAVCIPLRWQDRWLLHRAVTLPQHIEQHT